MNDAILLQYTLEPELPGDEDYYPMLELARPRHQRYCDAHGFDYRVSRFPFDVEQRLGGWARVDMIAEAMGEGYQYIVYMDVDAFIVRMDVDLRQACPVDGIGAVALRSPFEHWNAGVLYLGNGPRCREFVNRWVQAPPGEPTHEQYVLNKLGHGYVTTLPAEWNLTRIWSGDEVEPIVYALHGQKPADVTTALMREFIKRVEEK